MNKNDLNNFEIWVLKKRAIWFHILVGYLTCFVWVIVYFYCKIKFDKLKEKKEKNDNNYKNDFKNTKNVTINEKTEYFNCEIIMDCHKSECHRFINTCLYFDIIDKNDLYEGYSDKDLKENSLKIYRCANCYLPCEITANNNNKHYEIKYTEHSNNYYFGYIPIKYNDEIKDIINNKEIIFGGISFENGLYKEYNYEEDKIIEGYDQYKIKLKINYK